MTNLAAVDWIIPLIYFFFVVSIGLSLRQFLTSGNDFLLTRRALPAWLCGFAFAAASLGSLELLGMGAAGARYGLASAAFFGLGSVMPLLFAGLFLAPVYYASQASSLPGYLGLRFDGKTRALSAILFLIIQILTAAAALYVMARAFTALGLFNVLFHGQTIGSRGVMIGSVALPAALVLIYVLLGGLGATLYAQVMQFFVLVAELLPMVLLGLKAVGGWSGMQNSFAAAVAQTAAGAPGTGLGTLGLATGLGIVLTAGYWCTDPSLLQTTMAAESADAARRAPMIAAAARAVLPFLLVIPGIIAIGLPTPHTTMVEHTENGTIYHEINVVPRAAQEGLGVVPARTNSLTDPFGGKILRDAHGKVVLDYAMATPNEMPYNLPTGLLGLAVTVLFACVTGGVAARISAVNTIFTCDLFQPYLSRGSAEKHSLAVGRFTTLAAVVTSAALACLALQVPNMPGLLDLLALVFAVFFAPMLATFVLGVFWKRATGLGAFAGLLAGYAAALAHYGLTLPVGAARGLAGGWIAALNHPPSALAQNAGTALAAILANLVVTIAVSLITAAPPEGQLMNLVYPLTPARPAKNIAVFAGTVLLVSAVVSLIIF